MVKGISKHVIVVKTPISNIFDQAIFILNENALASSSVDAENLIREACAVANEYVREHCDKKRTYRSSKVFTIAAGGVGLLGIAWFLISFFI